MVVVHQNQKQKLMRKLLVSLVVALAGCSANNSYNPCPKDCDCGVCSLIDTLVIKYSGNEDVSVDSVSSNSFVVNHSEMNYLYSDSIAKLLSEDLNNTPVGEIKYLAKAWWFSPKIQDLLYGGEFFCWFEPYSNPTKLSILAREIRKLDNEFPFDFYDSPYLKYWESYANE